MDMMDKETLRQERTQEYEELKAKHDAVNKELDMEHRVRQLRQLRAKIKRYEEKFATFIEPYETAKKQLEAALMQWLLDRKIKTFTTVVGNITQVDNTTYPIEDLIAFMEYVIENQDWEMLDWKANKTRVNDYIKANADPKDKKAVHLPPGLRENPHPHLRVTPPKGEKKALDKKLKFNENTPEEE